LQGGFRERQSLQSPQWSSTSREKVELGPRPRSLTVLMLAGVCAGGFWGGVCGATGSTLLACLSNAAGATFVTMEDGVEWVPLLLVAGWLGLLSGGGSGGIIGMIAAGLLGLRWASERAVAVVSALLSALAGSLFGLLGGLIARGRDGGSLLPAAGIVIGLMIGLAGGFLLGRFLARCGVRRE
jgi:hypothetical protein